MSRNRRILQIAARTQSQLRLTHIAVHLVLPIPLRNPVNCQSLFRPPQNVVADVGSGPIKPRPQILFFIHRAQAFMQPEENLLSRILCRGVLKQHSLCIPQHLPLMHRDQPFKRPPISRLRFLNQLAEKILFAHESGERNRHLHAMLFQLLK